MVTKSGSGRGVPADGGGGYSSSSSSESKSAQTESQLRPARKARWVVSVMAPWLTASDEVTRR